LFPGADSGFLVTPLDMLFHGSVADVHVAGYLTVRWFPGIPDPSQNHTLLGGQGCHEKVFPVTLSTGGFMKSNGHGRFSTDLSLGDYPPK